jgi:hypothetical protein
MSNQINQVDELLKGLKKVPGFKSYLVLNSDGIVIRWEQGDGQMTYNSAVQHGETCCSFVPLALTMRSLTMLLIDTCIQ